MGFSPILLTLCDYIEEPLQYHEEFLSLQPMFPPKYFDNFSTEGGYSEGLDAFVFSLDCDAECANTKNQLVFPTRISNKWESEISPISKS